MMKTFILLIFVQLLHVIFGQTGTRECDKLKEKTCANCLAIPGCAWCSDPSFVGSRCSTPSKLQLSCRNHTVNIEGQVVRLDKVNLGSTSQISPKKATLKVRVGEPQTFTVEVQPAENYPVDLYYLMDLSHSMADDLENIKKLAKNISTKLNELTSEHRLAFGSYVDKTTPPFVKQEKIGKPFQSGSDIVYDFKHVVTFTKDREDFQRRIDKQKSSGNRDVPEGTFDALMQVAACEQKLEWNPYNTTRRMVLIATDATFHIAGEGKFGGVVSPNDAKCHLEDKSNFKEYTAALELDYPSIKQVHRRLQQSRIQPIFAVGPDYKADYDALVNTWNDLGATIGLLDGDSSNIVKLIETSYNKIVSTVQINTQGANDINVDIKANCGPGTTTIDGCKNVALGQNVSFEVSVTATTCQNGNSSSFTLVAAGFGEVTVDLEIICSCPCQFRTEPNSNICSGNGTLVCGRCDCDPGWSGQTCQCDSQSSKTSVDDQACRRSNSSNLICEGNGECDCGVCRCNLDGDTNERFYGEYCQCSDSNCEQYEGELCGGRSRGVCECGECQCKLGFLGSNCDEIDCTREIGKCLKNGVQGVNCSGHGECACGKCNCESFYQGRHCEDCPSCTGRCDDFKQCVLCKVFNAVPENKTLCDDCPDYEEVPSRDDLRKLNLLASCEYKDSEGCTYSFTYGNKNKTSNTTIIYAVRNKDCPEGPDVLLIVLATIGGIVGIGLILLILWKLLTAMADRREYQKFEQDRAKSKWHREKNPLYQPATSTVQNPTFVGAKKA